VEEQPGGGLRCPKVAGCEALNAEGGTQGNFL